MTFSNPAPTDARRTLPLVIAAVVGAAILTVGGYLLLTQTGVFRAFLGEPVISVERGSSPQEVEEALLGRWGTSHDGGGHRYEFLSDGTGSRPGPDGSRVDFTWYVTDAGDLALRGLPDRADEEWEVRVFPEGDGQRMRIENPDLLEWSLTLARHDDDTQA